MGKLMDIVGPLILLGGALFVFSKRCDLFGMCGETGSDPIDGSTEEEEGDTIQDTPAETKDLGTSSSGKSYQSSGCCVCRTENNGDVRCQRSGSGTWTRYKSAKQDFNKAMEICQKGCGGSGSSSGGSSNKAVRCPTNYASVNGRCVKSGSTSRGGTGKGSGGTGSNRGTTSTPTYTKNPNNSVVGSGQKIDENKLRNAWAGGKRGTVGYTYRSYFADPYYPRPFNLYHRIAN